MHKIALRDIKRLREIILKVLHIVYYIFCCVAMLPLQCNFPGADHLNEV